MCRLLENILEKKFVQKMLIFMFRDLMNRAVVIGMKRFSADIEEDILKPITPLRF